MPHRAGKFITFEGGEGTGKSTQARLLAAALERAGRTVLATREPGGSEGAEQIRTLLVDGSADRWDPMCEALLLFAARRDHVRRVLGPALARGDWVICDRFTDSTVAYQGIAGGLGMTVIENLAALALDGECPVPDLTLVLDLPAIDGLSRAQERDSGEQRFESLDTGFHEQLRQGFLTIADKNPDRCAVIDAAPDTATVASGIWSVVAERLGA